MNRATTLTLAVALGVTAIATSGRAASAAPSAGPSGASVVATSGCDRRRWRQQGQERHHLIDPATALPAQGDLLTVTVAAPTAAEAEVRAKTLFLAGSAEQATAEADALGVPAVLVMRAGATLLAGGLA